MLNNETKSALIFGAGITGANVYELTKNTYNIIGFIDNDKKKTNQTSYGLPIYSPSSIPVISCDYFLIASYTGLEPMYKQLTQEYGIPAAKIIRSYVEGSNIARLQALSHMAKIIETRGSTGKIAELGVFQGEFASNIQRVLPKREFYLFDTFEGFADADVKIETEREFSAAAVGDLDMTSVDLVLGKMPHPEMCVVKKGFFPQTTEGLENERFAFVSLDVDLYAPTLEGLRYFYPRLEQGGFIFLDDYFNEGYSGVRHALADYEREISSPLHYAPLGDAFTLVIVK